MLLAASNRTIGSTTVRFHRDCRRDFPSGPSVSSASFCQQDRPLARFAFTVRQRSSVRFTLVKAPSRARGTFYSSARDFHSCCDTKYLMARVNVGCNSSGSKCGFANSLNGREFFRRRNLSFGRPGPGNSREARASRRASSALRRSVGSSAESISRAGIRIADVNYYARRSANCLIAWRAL